MLKKIVAVDDDVFMLDIIKACLGDVCEVVTTSDGKESFELIKAEQPDMVILDLLMPGVTGLDILARLRHSDLKMPVLMLTSLGEINIAGQALALGACEFITKPFNPNELRRSVELKLFPDNSGHDDTPWKVKD